MARIDLNQCVYRFGDHRQGIKNGQNQIRPALPFGHLAGARQRCPILRPGVHILSPDHLYCPSKADVSTLQKTGHLYFAIDTQVESILPGPLEAVQATGATPLQTIIYAVIPQIIPPYISFTMYRWDINVRMSIIIGFAGGRGLAFCCSRISTCSTSGQPAPRCWPSPLSWRRWITSARRCESGTFSIKERIPKIGV